MRLKDDQVEAIKKTAQRRFGSNARVYLFGSRIDETCRGGDIDLYISSPIPRYRIVSVWNSASRWIF